MPCSELQTLLLYNAWCIIVYIKYSNRWMLYIFLWGNCMFLIISSTCVIELLLCYSKHLTILIPNFKDFTSLIDFKKCNGKRHCPLCLLELHKMQDFDFSWENIWVKSNVHLKKKKIFKNVLTFMYPLLILSFSTVKEKSL